MNRTSALKFKESHGFDCSAFLDHRLSWPESKSVGFIAGGPNNRDTGEYNRYIRPYEVKPVTGRAWGAVHQNDPKSAEEQYYASEYNTLLEWMDEGSLPPHRSQPADKREEIRKISLLADEALARNSTVEDFEKAGAIKTIENPTRVIWPGVAVPVQGMMCPYENWTNSNHAEKRAEIPKISVPVNSPTLGREFWDARSSACADLVKEVAIKAIETPPGEIHCFSEKLFVGFGDFSESLKGRDFRGEREQPDLCERFGGGNFCGGREQPEFGGGDFRGGREQPEFGGGDFRGVREQPGLCERFGGGGFSGEKEQVVEFDDLYEQEQLIEIGGDNSQLVESDYFSEQQVVGFSGEKQQVVGFSGENSQKVGYLKRRLCRHFVKGFCVRGQSCDFLHDTSIFCSDDQKVFLGGLPSQIPVEILKSQLEAQGLTVLNKPRIIRGFTPQVCLGSVKEAQELIAQQYLFICGQRVEVRSYQDKGKLRKVGSVVKRSVFLGGLAENTTGEIIMADLQRLDIQVAVIPIVKSGFAPRVVLESMKDAKLLVTMKRIVINGSFVDVRPYVNFRRRY